MKFIILLVLLAVIAFWFVGIYNGLIALKNQVANAWKQIDVQLQRRHSLIPNLVNAVKGAMAHERGTLEAVIAARQQAVNLEKSGASVGQIKAAEDQLTGALSRLMVVVEQYPELKATGNVSELQEELVSTENKIAFARQHYNDTATMYNTRQAQFPASLVAGTAGASPAELWEVGNAAVREDVTVDLGNTPVRPGA